MKGYFTANGYMGYVDERYMLFCSENDYIEYMKEYYVTNQSVEAA